MLCMPCGCDTDEALSEEDNELRLILWKWLKANTTTRSTGITSNKHNQVNHWDLDLIPGRHLRKYHHVKHVGHAEGAMAGNITELLATANTCMLSRWVPPCEACQERKSRWKGDHTYRMGECVWADKDLRAFGCRARSSARPMNHSSDGIQNRRLM